MTNSNSFFILILTFHSRTDQLPQQIQSAIDPIGNLQKPPAFINIIYKPVQKVPALYFRVYKIDTCITLNKAITAINKTIEVYIRLVFLASQLGR